MPGFLSIFRKIIGLTALVATSILCGALLCGLVLVFVSPLTRFEFARVLDIPIYKFAVPPQRSPDYSSIYSDYQESADWVLGCMGYRSEDQAPFELQQTVLSLPDINSQSSYLGDDSSVDVALPTHSELELISLSKSIAEQRISLSVKVRSAYLYWGLSSIISIAIGMITTILVSVSSTDFGKGDARYQKLIRIFAIVFPALGTAAAAITAFFSPQTEWSQDSRTLASLTQLQQQMDLGIWKLNCGPQNTDSIQSNDTKILISQLDDWFKRYSDIQTISTAVGASGSSQDGGGSSSGAGGGNSSSQNPPGGGAHS